MDTLYTMLQDFDEANDVGKKDMFDEAAERMITAEKAIVEKDRTIATLTAALAEANTLITHVEWVMDNEVATRRCPWCGNYQPEGHTDNCRAAAWLAKHSQP